MPGCFHQSEENLSQAAGVSFWDYLYISRHFLASVLARKSSLPQSLPRTPRAGRETSLYTRSAVLDLLGN
jgi:hypothetical protein